MTQEIWGGILVAYILVGIVMMGMGNGTGQKPDGLPGSARVAIWEAREKRWKIASLVWIVGLVALLMASAT